MLAESAIVDGANLIHENIRVSFQTGPFFRNMHAQDSSLSDNLCGDGTNDGTGMNFVQQVGLNHDNGSYLSGLCPHLGVEIGQIDMKFLNLHSGRPSSNCSMTAKISIEERHVAADSLQSLFFKSFLL